MVCVYMFVCICLCACVRARVQENEQKPSKQLFAHFAERVPLTLNVEFCYSESRQAPQFLFARCATVLLSLLLMVLLLLMHFTAKIDV